MKRPSPDAHENTDPAPAPRIEDAGEPRPGPSPDPLEPRAKPHHRLGFFQRRGTPLQDILEERICYLPPQTCEGCRHLGPPVYVRGPRGDRRVRRFCLHARNGHTAPDWPRCDSYEGLSAAPGLLSIGTTATTPKVRID